MDQLGAGRFDDAAAHLERHILEAARDFLHDLAVYQNRDGD
jgi:hypothetical protein